MAKRRDRGGQGRGGSAPVKGSSSNAGKIKPGSPLPEGYNGPAGQVKGKKPRTGNPKTEVRGPKKKNRPTISDAPGTGVPTPGGSTTDPGGGTVPPPATTDTAAYKILQQYLTMAGFPPDMTDFIQGKINSNELPEDATAEDYIFVAVEHPSFKARFPTIVEQVKRRSAGDLNVRIMMPAEVLDYETQVRNAADDYGLSNWVSSPDQIAKLILNDVDVNEAKERINYAGYAAQQAPKAFRDAFIGRFGLTEGNLVGFFLDPDKEEGEIRKQVTLGNVMGAALSNGFGNDWRTAERLYAKGYIPEGVSVDQAMSSFARATLSSELSSGLGETVSEADRIDAAFGDAAADRKVTSVSAQRQGRFVNTGGAVEAQTGVAGLGASSTT